jgi:hypothetical protein
MLRKYSFYVAPDFSEEGVAVKLWTLTPCTNNSTRLKLTTKMTRIFTRDNRLPRFVVEFTRLRDEDATAPPILGLKHLKEGVQYRY